MTEYVFNIKGVEFVIDDEIKHAIEFFEQGLVYRYAIETLLRAELNRQKIPEKTGIPLKSLVEQVLEMHRKGEYEVKKNVTGV